MGGAVFNRGDIIVDGESSFSGGVASVGVEAVDDDSIVALLATSAANFQTPGPANWQQAAWFSPLCRVAYGRFLRRSPGTAYSTYLPSNDRQEGGAIYQTKIGTMTFNAMATFSSNQAFEVCMRPALVSHAWRSRACRTHQRWLCRVVGKWS